MILDIMLPFWGKPEYLFETVHSVLRQDCDNWHLTVVDDHYPDERVAAFFHELTDPRVRYIRNQKNLGITANYQRCLELAREEYMMFLGCDDLMASNYVSTILTCIRTFPDADVVQPGVRTIDSDGTIVRPLGDKVKNLLAPSPRRGTHIVEGEHACATLLTGDWLYWPSLTFRSETLRTTPFRDGLPLIQDLALVIDILAHGGHLLVEPSICFYYRRHTSSASGSTLLDGTRFEGERRYFSIAASLMKELGWRRAYWAARVHATSRLYAITLLPEAIQSGNGSNLRALLRHVCA